ncbi:LOW QUALITY PROTEIN: putative lipase ROG1 [Pistacia vera]|uniref:LOW QUALITY PROTEIN: putative lipase ROG1 n=1 Tax=Pistacia vera TaxID=55513 RepID=UPI001263323B|nr:LOW QUALITY PROTEIN: putative lipase ROG1 [Pistacia vera]
MNLPSSLQSKRHPTIQVSYAMASIEGGSASLHVRGSKKEQVAQIKKSYENEKEKKKSARYSHIPRFSCLKTKTDEMGNFDLEMEVKTDQGDRPSPTHLVVMVNGIIGSAPNWKYAARQFLMKYPEDLIVHCSKRNSSMLTFDGVDVMGDRLAQEVISVIKRRPSVQKISFISHSLGGLISRYAIARLYGRDVTSELPQGNGEYRDNGSGDTFQNGKIAGLEPINFITSATPHLGSRGHKQVPVFCGFYTLEKAAARTSWFLGRTGKHLFLTDSDEGKPPLLLQMVTDCEDLKFISALQSFRRRVAYANARFDHLVGWSTSSLRLPDELPKKQHLRRADKYPHVVNVETAKTASPREEINLESIKPGSETADIQEKMLRGLTAVSWERVDVNFSGSKQRFLAHSTIQVKTYCINSDGADVIQHMIDNFIP